MLRSACTCIQLSYFKYLMHYNCLVDSMFQGGGRTVFENSAPHYESTSTVDRAPALRPFQPYGG